MNISLIIPAYNEGKYISDTLKSVVDNAPDNLLEIIVVNNASTDNTAALAAGFDKVRVVEEPHKGITWARQAGLLAAKGELLAYIDADTKVSKKWFEILNKEFSKNKTLVCLSGPYDYYDLSPKKLFVVKVWYGFVSAITFFKGLAIQGGNFVATKQSLLDMGGFDRTIEFFGEDTDIVNRLHKMGKVKFLNSFKVRSSARRLNGGGLVKTGFKYLVNYLSMLVIHRPVHEKYDDFR